jgi:hypothetical protein
MIAFAIGIAAIFMPGAAAQDAAKPKALGMYTLEDGFVHVGGKKTNAGAQPAPGSVEGSLRPCSVPECEDAAGLYFLPDKNQCEAFLPLDS